VNRRDGQCVYIWRLGTMKMQHTIKSKFPQNTTPQLHFRSSKTPKYLSKKTKCLPCNRLSSMVIVRYTIHPFPQSHSSSLTVLSRPKPLENRPHPRRAQHPLHNQIYTTPELKQPAFLAINRNGMAPVIEDPNTGLKLAEVSTQTTIHQHPSTDKPPSPAP